jgi:tetratricopeptide (TPR) repeat protein
VAYDAYLRGQHLVIERTDKEGFERAIEYFKNAIEEDPTYAEAYAGLAEAYFLQASYSHRTISEVYPLERAAALKALEIDPTLAYAHAMMGLIERHDWNWAGAEAQLKRAIELNPNFLRAQSGYAIILTHQRRFDEALVEARKVRDLDPFAPGALVGQILLFKKEYDAAIEDLQNSLEINPRGRFNNTWLVRSYWFKGEHEEAIEQAERAASLGVQPQRPVFLRHLLAGNREEAVRTIENWDSPLQPHTRAGMYAMLGDKDRAIELLEKGLEEGYTGVMWANVHPEFEPLRSDPRFQDLLRRMNLEP